MTTLNKLGSAFLPAIALWSAACIGLIGGDDHQTAERFAAEVAPAVRDLVQRERGAARTHT